ncbi:efflux RND transporter periplasmic adaptor subunit [bacterium]|nr:efflux RND transporter periplasmic adaptor subunit [bacterium]
MKKENCACAFSTKLAGMILLASCAFAAPEAQKAYVAVGTVSSTQNIVQHRYTGRVVSPAKVDLVARVSGELKEVGFEEGSFVEEGQIMYKLDDVQYKASVMSAEAKLAEAQAKYEYAEQTYKRIEDLYGKQVTAKDNLDNAKSGMNVAKAAVQAAEASLLTAQENLSYTIIVSPIAGKVGTTAITKGNYVTPSSGILASVIQQDPLRVRFAISNKNFLQDYGTEKELKENSEVVLKLGDGTIYPVTGKVSITENQSNEATDTMILYAVFANPDRKLSPGSTVSVLLRKKETAFYPCVLPSAVMHDGTSSYVYVLDDQNVPSRRNVKEGVQSGDKQIILEGLKEGERVVTDGMLKVVPGTPVVPVEE